MIDSLHQISRHDPVSESGAPRLSWAQANPSGQTHRTAGARTQELPRHLGTMLTIGSLQTAPMLYSGGGAPEPREAAMEVHEPIDEDAKETTYAQGRIPSRIYASRTFPLKRTGSTDDGAPSRFAYKVLDPREETIVECEGEEWVIKTTPKGRYQFKLLLVREQGNVKRLWIQRVPAQGRTDAVKNLLSLEQREASQLVSFLKTLDVLPIEGEAAVRLDDSLIQEILANPAAISGLYDERPALFRRLITDDTAARDVIALASRREAVNRFRGMLEANATDASSGRESIADPDERQWQLFFEANPWILGATLSSQLVTAWSDDKLEQIVTGHDISSVGKRSDALMRTAGRVRSMVFIELKTHQTKLLSTEYRPGCWSISPEVSGGVAQLQGTVHRAVQQIGLRLASRDDSGFEIPGDVTYLIQPRSVLVVGDLGQLRSSDQGDHTEKIRSFELYRRNLNAPEIVTFDELLARAEWIVDAAAEEDLSQSD